MEWEGNEKEVKAAGAELLSDGRQGLRIHGWEIESRKCSILNSAQRQQWEERLSTSHLPEMIFGENSLTLKHVTSGVKIHLNAFDALVGWKQEGLPPVEVPAAAIWKCRNKPSQQMVLDYDYTFTTPYCGSEMIETNSQNERGTPKENSCSLQWVICKEKIDLVTLALKEPILFYDEIILYEDELADNGISLLTVKVRVMPTGWFLLLRFWLRVDGVLMRLRDTRLHCTFVAPGKSVILRESCWRETSFESLASKGLPTDSSAYSDPSISSERLPVILQRTQKLNISDSM